MARRCPMGQLCNAIKRRPAARRAARSELLRARSRYPGPIVGLWGNSDHRRALCIRIPSLSLSLSFSVERKLHCEKHFDSRNAYYGTRTVYRFRCWKPETLLNRKQQVREAARFYRPVCNLRNSRNPR